MRAPVDEVPPRHHDPAADDVDPARGGTDQGLRIDEEGVDFAEVRRARRIRGGGMGGSRLGGTTLEQVRQERAVG
jgi:hypothetical protein